MGTTELIAAVGGGSFVLASLVVGCRLIGLAARTRALPELVLGGGLLLMGGIGYPMVSTAQHATGLSDALRQTFFGIHMLGNVIGMGGVALFTRRVFRPRETWAGGLAAGVPAVLAVAMVLQWMAGSMEFLSTNRGPWQLIHPIGVATLTWAALESLRYWRLLRRREKLGLADPVVTDRMRLWGFGIGAGASIQLLSLSLEALGIQVTGTALSAIIVGPLGVTAAALVYLAFMPPEFYLRRVQARAAAG